VQIYELCIAHKGSLFYQLDLVCHVVMPSSCV